MQVGELFVNLGIKGADKASSAITGVRDKMTDVKSTSLEAKAAIIGAMYALERLFSASGKAGTDLTNLNQVMGVSTKTLQQYQYAARQVGLSNDEMSASLKNLQSLSAKTYLGTDRPKYVARVHELVGGMGYKEFEQYAREPEKLLQKLQEYAGKEQNAALRNEVLKSFGVSDNMLAALSRKAFRPEVLNKAPTYSENQVKSLDEANIAWANLGNKIEMAIGKFNAEHGGEMVKGISNIVDQVVKLAEAFERLATKLKLFEYMGKVFEGWGIILSGVSDSVDALSNGTAGEKLKEKLGELPGVVTEATGSETAGKAVGVAGDVAGGIAASAKFYKNLLFGGGSNQPTQENAPQVINTPSSPVIIKTPSSPVAPSVQKSPVTLPPPYGPKIPSNVIPMTKEKPAALPVGKIAAPQAATPVIKMLTPQAQGIPSPKALEPRMPAVASAGNQNTNNINVNQSLNFQHPGTDATKTADSVKQAVKSAYYQTYAQGQTV